MRFFKIIVLFCLIISKLQPVYAEDSFKNRIDTVKPLSIFCHYFEIKRTTFNTPISFTQYIDSVLFHENLSAEERNQLILFKNLYRESEDDFLLLIDSILDLDIISNDLLVAINYFNTYVYNEDNMPVENAALAISCDTGDEYPAGSLYNNIWCNHIPNPYPPELTENDSLITIRICEDTVDFFMPVQESRVTSRYGWRNGRMHQGIDLGVGYSMPIYNTFSGVVRFAKFYQGYGRLVIVRHNNGMETYYAHLCRIRVKVGQKVNAGEVLGLAGNSGASDGTHLHFEIRYKGVPINPAHLISFTENKLLFNEIVLLKVKSNFFVYNENAILYTVQRGDYLNKIAREYGITVNRLCEVNDMSRNQTLRVGQILRILM
ncbi:MAG: M23 family metallopeptidase [Bacteroidales bacterium]|nr:M23 family metallopeptidase [Bacteroidales bacterium]